MCIPERERGRPRLSQGGSGGQLSPLQPRAPSALLACLAWLPLAQTPEAWLLLANVVVVLILVPVKDHLLDPLLLRCKLLPSALQKMALGMFFGFASVVVAGEWRDKVEGAWLHFGLMLVLWARGPSRPSCRGCHLGFPEGVS